MSQFVFPGVPVGFRCNDAGVDPIPSVGLTKRELFAAMSLQGILANPNLVGVDSDGSCFGRGQNEEYAVEQADALIKELSKSS